MKKAARKTLSELDGCASVAAWLVWITLALLITGICCVSALHWSPPEVREIGWLAVVLTGLFVVDSLAAVLYRPSIWSRSHRYKALQKVLYLQGALGVIFLSLIMSSSSAAGDGPSDGGGTSDESRGTHVSDGAGSGADASDEDEFGDAMAHLVAVTSVCWGGMAGMGLALQIPIRRAEAAEEGRRLAKERRQQETQLRWRMAPSSRNSAGRSVSSRRRGR